MARTAARRVPGPHSTWFLAAVAKMSRASSSGAYLAGTRAPVRALCRPVGSKTYVGYGVQSAA